MTVAASAVPRNRPCPCGSGRKHKLCCGTTRTEERERARLENSLFAIAQLPLALPLARPMSEEFDGWADEVAASSGAADEEQNTRRLDAGLKVLSGAERERILGVVRREAPEIHELALQKVGEQAFSEAITMGAVVAGVNERGHGPEPHGLRLLEEDSTLRADPAEALSFAIDARDLWSAAEALRVDDALAAIPYDDFDDEDPELDRLWHRTVAAMARRMETPAHRRRLERLVGYLRTRLSLEDYPQASHALATACDAFARDRSVRKRVAALLLVDTL